MKKKTFRSAGAAGAVAAALVLTACGSPSQPDAVQPVKTLLKQSDILNVKSGFEYRTIFTTTSVGTISAHVDWTFADSWVWIALVAGDNPCVADGFFHPKTCPWIALVDSQGVKPQELTAAGQPAGTYTLYMVDGKSLQNEALSYQVFLTR